MRLAKSIIAASVTALALYLFFAFSRAEFDISLWEQQDRGLCALFMLYGGIFVASRVWKESA